MTTPIVSSETWSSVRTKINNSIDVLATGKADITAVYSTIKRRV